MNQTVQAIAVICGIICIVLAILSLLLFITEVCMLMFGYGWMQAFGYSWEFDSGEAIGGSYSGDTPYHVNSIDKKYNIYYKDGLNLPTVAIIGVIGSVILFVPCMALSDASKK